MLLYKLCMTTYFFFLEYAEQISKYHKPYLAQSKSVKYS